MVAGKEARNNQKRILAHVPHLEMMKHKRLMGLLSLQDMWKMVCKWRAFTGLKNEGITDVVEGTEETEIPFIDLCEADSNCGSGDCNDKFDERSTPTKGDEKEGDIMNLRTEFAEQDGDEDGGSDSDIIDAENTIANEEEDNFSKTPFDEQCKAVKRKAGSSRTTGSWKNGMDGTKTLAPRRIMELFHISGCDKVRIGIKKLKTIRVRDMPSFSKFILLRVFKNIIAKIALSFAPKNYQQLIYDVMENLGYPLSREGSSA